MREYEKERTGLERLEPPPPQKMWEEPKPASDPRIRRMNTRLLTVGTATET